MEKRKKGDKKPENVRIIFVSAVCGKEPELMTSFLEEFDSFAKKQDKKTFVLIFCGKASDPSKLLRKADILVTDPVITWGGRKTFLPQLGSANDERENGKRRIIIVLPRKKDERNKFFADPRCFAKTLMPNVEHPRKVEKISHIPLNGKTLEKIEDEVIFELPEHCSAPRVMIALSNSFEMIEAKKLKETIEAQFALEVMVVPWKSFRASMAAEADVLITSTVQQLDRLPTPARVPTNRHNGRNNKFVESKVHTYQNLAHVDMSKKANPALQVVLLGREVTAFIVRYADILSGFLEFPPTKASLSAALQRAALKSEKSVLIN
ncbi:hypothetical protein HN784_03705 [bacterium]|jgi:hypothetical protein|nr:hypothetical protein [bacterium]MBT4251101.1 hypothetical protein [bacterium]MBT4598107.1 hypothetical protein [bacterium]MBT6753449.1 hypothetical protein [bacterium]MBT7038162.1 hypothetical protein [bacterium]